MTLKFSCILPLLEPEYLSTVEADFMHMNKIASGFIFVLGVATAHAQLAGPATVDRIKIDKDPESELAVVAAAAPDSEKAQVYQNEVYQLSRDRRPKCDTPPPPPPPPPPPHSEPPPPPVPVPEPATYGVIGVVGLLGLIAARRRRAS